MQNLKGGSRRDRVCGKFVESEFEKIDRLMEVYIVRSAAAFDGCKKCTP